MSFTIRLLDKNKRTHKKPEHIQKSSALLGGLVFCSQCGSKMWYKKTYRQGKQYGNYICANREESKTCDMLAIAASIIEPYKETDTRKNEKARTGIQNSQKSIAKFGDIGPD